MSNRNNVGLRNKKKEIISLIKKCREYKKELNRLRKNSKQKLTKLVCHELSYYNKVIRSYRKELAIINAEINKVKTEFRKPETKTILTFGLIFLALVALSYYFIQPKITGFAVLDEVNLTNISSTTFTTQPVNTSENISNISLPIEKLGSIENFTEIITQVKAELNKPTEWKLITKNKTIGIPQESTNIIVEKINSDSTKTQAKLKDNFKETSSGEKQIEVDEANDTDIEVTYYTKAPYSIESEFIESSDTLVKNVTIKSDSELHYSNVLSYTDIQESSKELIKLYHFVFNNITNATEKIDVTQDAIYNVSFVDSNNNGLIDRITWVTPHLSEENFSVEISLDILTVQSYPTVGGNWIVIFNTIGTADLTIRAVNGTTWSNLEENSDLKFLEVSCGSTTQAYQWINNSTYIPSYSCNETSKEISKVLTTGIHNLEFTFGNITKYAHNFATDAIIWGNLSQIIGDSNSTGNLNNTMKIYWNSSCSNEFTIPINTTTPCNSQAGLEFSSVAYNQTNGLVGDVNTTKFSVNNTGGLLVNITVAVNTTDKIITSINWTVKANVTATPANYMKVGLWVWNWSGKHWVNASKVFGGNTSYINNSAPQIRTINISQKVIQDYVNKTTYVSYLWIQVNASNGSGGLNTLNNLTVDLISVNVSWAPRIVIYANGTIPANPAVGNNVTIFLNSSRNDRSNNYEWVNFSLVAPNGSIYFNNLNGSSTGNGTGISDNWTSYGITIYAGGTYNWNYTIKTGGGSYKFVTGTFNIPTPIIWGNLSQIIGDSNSTGNLNNTLQIYWNSSCINEFTIPVNRTDPCGPGIEFGSADYNQTNGLNSDVNISKFSTNNTGGLLVNITVADNTTDKIISSLNWTVKANVTFTFVNQMKVGLWVWNWSGKHWVNASKVFGGNTSYINNSAPQIRTVNITTNIGDYINKTKYTSYLWIQVNASNGSGGMALIRNFTVDYIGINVSYAPRIVIWNNGTIPAVPALNDNVTVFINATRNDRSTNYEWINFSFVAPNGSIFYSNLNGSSNGNSLGDNWTSKDIKADVTGAYNWNYTIKTSGSSYKTVTGSFTVAAVGGNNAPSNANTTITSSSPTKQKDLNCTWTYLDPDNNTGTGTIIWYNNSAEHFRVNISIPTGNNTIVSYTLLRNTTNNFTQGENWTCAGLANDGTINSAAWVNASVVIQNTAPEIYYVENTTTQSITENNYTNVTISFYVNDLDGAATVGFNNSRLNLTKTNSPTAPNRGTLANPIMNYSSATSGGCFVSGNINSTVANVSCSVHIWYFDSAGQWNISIGYNDSVAYTQNVTHNFTLSATSAIQINPSNLTFNSGNPGADNITSNNDPIIVNNTGNVAATSGNVRITGRNLIGETTKTQYIPAVNFTVEAVNFTNSDPNAGCRNSASGSNATALTNASAAGITNSVLAVGNHSINNGTSGIEHLFICLFDVPFNINSQSYSTRELGTWTIDVV